MAGGQQFLGHRVAQAAAGTVDAVEGDIVAFPRVQECLQVGRVPVGVVVAEDEPGTHGDAVGAHGQRGGQAAAVPGAAG